VDKGKAVNVGFFYCEGSQTLTQLAQRGCGISVLCDAKNPTRHSLGQAAVAGPA